MGGSAGGAAPLTAERISLRHVQHVVIPAGNTEGHTFSRVQVMLPAVVMALSSPDQGDVVDEPAPAVVQTRGFDS